MKSRSDAGGGPRHDATWAQAITSGLLHEIDGVYEALSGSEDVNHYHDRHDTKSLLILTQTEPAESRRAACSVRLQQLIHDKTVLEIGAGVGLLAIEMAKTAKHVYAIEVDESAIIRELLRVGCRVFRVLKADPAGCPDLFVFFRGSYVALEIKSDDGCLTAEQAELFAAGGSRVVRDAKSALRAIGAIRDAPTSALRERVAERSRKRS